MAYPNDLPGLHAWYRADSFSLDDGDQCPDWVDKSGHNRTMVSSTALTTKPKWYSNQIAGQPAIRIVQADQQYFRCASFAWLASLASHTIFIVWKASSSNPYGIVTSAGGANSEAIYQATDTEIRKRYNKVGTQYTVSATLPINEWHFAMCYQEGTTQIGISVDGGTEATTTTGGPRAGNPTAEGNIGVDGAGYCDGWLAEVIVFSRALNSSERQAINDYLRARYFALTPSQNEQVRDVLSRRLWLLRRSNGQPEISVPLWMLDADIFDRVAMELQYGPAPGGLGWRSKKWQRRPFSIQRIEDTADGVVRLTLLDRRPLDVLLWDTGRTEEPALVLNAARESGVARISKGNAHIFSRPTRAWVLNPADATAVIEIQQDRRALTTLGEWLESTRTNLCLRSSFLSGTTGLTLTGEATNGSDIATDANDLFFNKEMGGSSLKFTAGSPHAADLSCAFPATSVQPGTNEVRISVDHKTDSGEPLALKIQRSGDNWWWNDDADAWQADDVANPLNAHADRDPEKRWISKMISLGGMPAAITVTVLLPTGGASGRVSHLYHVQAELGSFPSSRIVSDDAETTREATRLKIAVPAARKCYDPALGSFFCEVVPDWSSADLAAGEDATVFWMTIDGGAGYDRLYYDASAGAWTFERKVGETVYAATKAATVLRDTAYKLGARWTGADGELDLAPYTLSIFVDGAKGTDAVSEAPRFSPTGESLYFGSDAAFGAQLNGAQRERRVFPYALADEEIGRLP